MSGWSYVSRGRYEHPQFGAVVLRAPGWFVESTGAGPFVLADDAQEAATKPVAVDRLQHELTRRERLRLDESARYWLARGHGRFGTARRLVAQHLCSWDDAAAAAERVADRIGDLSGCPRRAS